MKNINTGKDESGNDTVSKTSPEYEVKDVKDQKVSLNILAIHYGNLWEFALDRLDHQFDGFLLAFWHQGQRFRIYRKQKDKKHSYYPVRSKKPSFHNRKIMRSRSNSSESYRFYTHFLDMPSAFRHIAA